MLLSVVIVSLATACGGSADVVPAGPLAAVITGVASADAPLAGVTLRDSSEPVKQATAEVRADGSYAVDVSGLTPPYVLEAAVAGTAAVGSVHAVTSGEPANINPLTDAAVSGAAGGADPAELFARAEPARTRDAAARLPEIARKLDDALAPLLEQYGVDPDGGIAGADPRAIDALLRDVDVDVKSGVVSVTNSETSQVIFQAPSTDPASGTFVAAAMPAAAPVPQPSVPADDPAVTVTAAVRYPPLSRMTRAPQPPLSEPALGQTATFSDLGTAVTHVSDSRHHYAKTPVWNVDESLAVTNDGKIWNGTTYAFVRQVTLPNEHKTWSNTDPRYIYGANRSQRQWVRVDATTGASTVLATYSQYSTVSYGLYEGNLDNNDSGAALIGDGKVFLINPKTGAARCTVTGGGGYGNTVSDATMSQDGKFVLVNWVGYGIDAYNASDCSFRKRVTTATSHYDACVSTAGEQVVVQPYSGGYLKMYPIASGSAGEGTTLLKDSAQRIHVSCRNTKRPGWAYISIDNMSCDSTLTGMTAFHRIWAVKLDGSAAVEHYAWDHQACPAPYSDNPMAVPSRLGNRVWFKAVWDGSSTGLHSFVAERR